MTTVTFRMEGDRITGFDSKGHSGYAEAGSDIVCAAITSAIRLVEAMPRWTPAMKDGKPVATEFTLPVYFPSALAENFPDLSKTQSHPLVVVDGVLMEWEAFDLQVQPSEIESFRILTGEDAAAYGTRGEREGVIIITRKKTASAAQADSVPHIRIRINGNADGNVGSKMAVAGVVTDEAGSPIVGAIVREVGGKDGVVTDREGRFSLSVPRDATLEVMYVGFQTVKAKPQANMTVVLKPE